MADYLFRPRRAASSAYQIPPRQLDLYTDGPELFAIRALFPDRQVAQERVLFPDRRARRRSFPTLGGRIDNLELFGSRQLLPSWAPGPRRAASRAYQIVPFGLVPLDAPQVPAELQNRLLPDRAPGALRAAKRAYDIDEATVELYGGQTPVTVEQTLLPDRAPGVRPNRSAYELHATQIDFFQESEEQHQRRLVPERTSRTPWASAAAYVIQPMQVDLFAAEDELLSARQAIQGRAPGASRAAASAYWLASPTVEIISADDAAFPRGQALFPDRQIVEDRAQYPARRQRRKSIPGTVDPPPVFSDFPELFACRALFPDRAPGAWRAARTSYLLATNPVDLYAPTAPTEFEELLGSRGLLPIRAPGAPRAGRDAYVVANNQADLYAPPPIPETNELFIGQMFPDRVAPARRRFRRKIFPGAPQITQKAEGQTLLPDRVTPALRLRGDAYQLDVFPPDFYAAQAPQNITHTILPERVWGRARAAASAYWLAPSLVELYGGHVPEEITHILLPSRAPGRPRAAASAYTLENNQTGLYAPPFVPPAVKPTRLLLGVGL